MQRYFVDEPFQQAGHVSITGDDYHHIVRVMRMEKGDQLILAFQKTAARAEIEQVTELAVECRVLKLLETDPELPVSITIASGLPKGDKLEWIVQKGTELGAAQFLVFAADRSVAKWEGKKVPKKLERLQKIAKEAAEQSHRTHLPEVDYVPSLCAFLQKEAATYDAVFCAYEESARSGERQTLADILEQAAPGARILGIFGPEGGISEKERKFLQEMGVRFAGLGPRILRTETAPLYVLSAASYHFDLAQ
ncbi:16S rRNA (uracil(1498)-N(3))-methyltransferase [Listeria costaricensis]|uniref:16S rRNA (uracil(1498)-N(3))-methyltransferase n=1 Tax=Listeria costaricensis TaxID=2026604 RepID=UPI000C088811|nr:16S rRNA (uracil(1498)-N(3))-methyltransferase [Listeria costaricensis]